MFFNKRIPYVVDLFFILLLLVKFGDKLSKCEISAKLALQY